MKLTMLLRESWSTTRARRVPATMVAVLCASMCATSLLTVGRTAGVEAQVLQRLEAAGSRQLVVGDRHGNDLLPPSVVEAVGALGTVERSVGLLLPRDVHAGTVGLGGPAVPAWGVVGAVSDATRLRQGREPATGEALLSERAAETLGFDGPSGFLVAGADEYPVVGIYVAREPFSELDSGAVFLAGHDAPARSLHVISSSASVAATSRRLTLQLVDPPAAKDLTIRSAADLAQLQQQLAGDLGNFGRHLLLLVLGAGGLLTTVVVLSDVLLRRPDLGRRRTLGASRMTLVALVLLPTAISASAGVLVGTAAGLGVGARIGFPAPAEFAASTAVLAVLAALCAAIAPALVAATRDPVQVLRAG